MSDEQTDEWNKAERLAVASVVAPSLRAAAEKTKARRVALVDKDGNVTGYTSLAKVQESLLRARELELAVGDGVRPKEVFCRRCGKTVKTNPKGGSLPSACIGGCDKQSTCGGSGCSKVPPKGAFHSREWEMRGGRPWMCKPCAGALRAKDPCALAAARSQTECAGGCSAPVPAHAALDYARRSRRGKPWVCQACASVRHLDEAGRSILAKAALQTSCAGDGCIQPLSKCALSPYEVRKRAGAPWMCKPCRNKSRLADPEYRKSNAERLIAARRAKAEK